jgi:hypothetical protein
VHVGDLSLPPPAEGPTEVAVRVAAGSVRRIHIAKAPSYGRIALGRLWGACAPAASTPPRSFAVSRLIHGRAGCPAVLALPKVMKMRGAAGSYPQAETRSRVLAEAEPKRFGSIPEIDANGPGCALGRQTAARSWLG